MALPLLRAVFSSIATQGGAAGRRLLGLGPGGMQITVRGNVRGELRRLDRLLKNHDQIVAAALNKAIRAARTDTVRRLSTALNVPQKVLRKRVKIYPARRADKPPHADMWVGTKRPIKTSELAGAVTTSRSGYIKVGKRIYKQAFRARMPGGHEGIFTRKPHARHKLRADGQMSQLPIEEAVVQLMPEAERISGQATREAFEQIFRAEYRRLARLRLQTRRL